MTKLHVRNSIAALMVLGFAASGCSAEVDSPEVEEKVVVPSTQVFEYAPEGEEIPVAKSTPVLDAKGSITLPFGPTHVQAMTITPGQNVSISTSGGSVGVDPVLVLFRRHDNSNVFAASPYTQQVGTTVLAINDDINPFPDRNASISYTNNTGSTLNAWLMVFAYNTSTGTTNLSNGQNNVQVVAGGFQLGAGATGQAATGNTNPTPPSGDPWLFTFGTQPGHAVGDGFWQDDKAVGVRDSLITGNHAQTQWYVAHGFSSGTTTITN
jgi:hypothetical protein